jgi:hypothetical protein
MHGLIRSEFIQSRFALLVDMFIGSTVHEHRWLVPRYVYNFNNYVLPFVFTCMVLYAILCKRTLLVIVYIYSKANFFRLPSQSAGNGKHGIQYTGYTRPHSVNLINQAGNANCHINLHLCSIYI